MKQKTLKTQFKLFINQRNSTAELKFSHKDLFSNIFYPFCRNKHIMIDLGTGNNNKINWTMEDKQEMIDIIETVYRGARKGRGLVVSPKDYSTKYRY